jgi:DNA topoisomerase-1
MHCSLSFAGAFLSKGITALKNHPELIAESEDPRLSARAAGLRYVTGEGPGIVRRRRGKGFEYLGAEGKPVRDKRTIERIRSLVIPPAWTDVWICPVENGHIQAVGRDAKGRKQPLSPSISSGAG